MAERIMKRSTKGPKTRNERNILTFYEKIAVIRYYEDTNISRNSLAKMFHCCATQIRRILDRKDELLQQLATLSEADASIIIEEMTRKRRKFEMSAISFILHQWVQRCRQMRLRKTITNQTLKDIALKMAAILNLPSFRPSYRWLNRFRTKYKYDEQDLGANDKSHTVLGELSVEDIIIEFKDSLPSFMQKEIAAITSFTKFTEKTNESPPEVVQSSNEITVLVANDNIDHPHISSSDDDEDEDEDTTNNNVAPTKCLPSTLDSPNSSLMDDSIDEEDAQRNTKVSDDTRATILNGVFPHLAVIHQFALLNSDIKALELISQLGVHLQAQASNGAYQQMSAPSASPNEASNGIDNETVDALYPDIDDIILIE